MGVDIRRPPLPAPTEPSTLDSGDNDVATTLSARTDKTSYSIPEDGTPVTINTAKREGIVQKKYPSQTSLLIEYFEGAKSEAKPKSRPSVRVRVTPSSRKNKTSNHHLQITQTSHDTRKPSYTRRISLVGKRRDELGRRNPDASYSNGSNASSLPRVDIEVLGNASDLSSSAGPLIPLTSEVSSMPTDSMLGSQPIINPPERRRSRSLERDDFLEALDAPDTLKAPTHQRSRSLSKERITARVMEKLQQKPVEGSASPRAKESKSVKQEPTSSRAAHRSMSRTSREEQMSAISTESSLLSSNAHRRSGDAHSVRSGVSGTSSINNPKLLATVEDAIKRLILPELNALKKEQRNTANRQKSERTLRDSAYEAVDPAVRSRDGSRRRVSVSSSAPHIHDSKPKVVLNRDEQDPGTIMSAGSSRKERRSSRASASERSYAGSTEEKVRRKKSKDKSRTSAHDTTLIGLTGAGLTAAALRSHNSHEDKEDRKGRRKRHSRSSRSRTSGISESVEEHHVEELRTDVPPLPMIHSELQGSELTRDSILSAETETRDRPHSQSSRETGLETPIRQVSREFPSISPRTPTRTPIALHRSLGTAYTNKSLGELGWATPQSDPSYPSRSREVSTVGYEAAAAAKVRAIESAEPNRSRYEIAEPNPTRGGLSPIQSEASYREKMHTTGSPRHPTSAHSYASVSSAGHNLQRPASNLSMQSFESSPSTKDARSRKRPQGVSLERAKEVFGEPNTPPDVMEFFEENHKKNDMYRRKYDVSARDSPALDHQRRTQYTNDSAERQNSDHKGSLSLSQNIGLVGSSPEYVHTPLAVESAVASLHEPSTISVPSVVDSPLRKSRQSQASSLPDQSILKGDAHLRERPSHERWVAPRNQAQTLAAPSGATNSPRQSLSHFLSKETANSPRQSLSYSVHESPRMLASALPTGDMMPEFGYGVDDESDISTNPFHDQTEELLKRQEERERTPTHPYGKSALVNGTMTAAMAASTTTYSRSISPVAYDEHHRASVGGYDDHYANDAPYEHMNYSKDHTPSRSPAGWKDEGYQSQSGNQIGGLTPETRNRSERLGGDYENEQAGAHLSAVNGKHARHMSGNSHGMSSPLYDAATGRGLDNIQSKDIVALMDHLTVRDAQRNARDTEILVTLVRSAAEMRNSFEEMKQYIKVQDAMIMNSTDKRVDLAEQRILGGPRPQPLGSPRAPRSSSDDFDIEVKKKNVFKRALKGLSLKGDGDIKKIEAMLMQLLGEVEGLKQFHQLSLDQQNRSNSLTSYENLRASGGPESGYEPEGLANTISSPNQSGFLSNPSSRRIQDLHSGFDVPQTHRISTVQEDDEEFAEAQPQYENTERMTTPTQEAHHNKSVTQLTPPPASRAFRESQSPENTPKRSKHKSNSSSIFGIPKISRWSKTTASTNPESLPRNSGSGERRPYSNTSRSGSRLNVAYGDAHYELDDDERAPSRVSLAKDERASIRSASPLIPADAEYTLDDPKYQAHRNSLNLQHPQPRPGHTGRHQNHLESQARNFEPMVGSPDYDQWGSNPSLARNRMSGGGASQGAGNLSPISSDGGYSQHSASEQQVAPSRPSKTLDDGPLFPQQAAPLAGRGQTRQMYSSPNEYGGQGTLTPLAPIQEVRYSLETDTGHRYTPTPSPRLSHRNLNPNTNAAMANPQRKITVPRPMGSRSPGAQQVQGGPIPLTHSDTVIRKKRVAGDTESLESYRSSLDSDSEIF